MRKVISVGLPTRMGVSCVSERACGELYKQTYSQVTLSRTYAATVCMREVNDNAEGLIILNFPHVCNVQKIIIFDKTNYINRHAVEGIFIGFNFLGSPLSLC